MTARKLAQQLRKHLGDTLSKPAEFRGEVTVTLVDSGRIVEACQFAKDELGFDYLIDLSTVDHYGAL